MRPVRPARSTASARIIRRKNTLKVCHSGREAGSSLIIISRLRNLARRLIVPGDKYGAARRLLRDKIGEHAIHFGGTGLDLGDHDERGNV